MSEQNNVTSQNPKPDQEATGRGEGVGQAKEVAGKSQNKIIFERLLRHKGAVGGFFVIVFIVLLSNTAMGAFGLKGWWKYHTPGASGDLVNNGSPSWEHPFGQDNLGADNFAMVMSGVQNSLVVVVLMVSVAAMIGITVGSLAGYYRGTIDMILMRVADTFIVLPVLVVGAVVGVMVATMPAKLNMSGPQTAFMYSIMPALLGLFLGFLSWPGLARLTRSEFLRLREMEFVDSARVAGASDRRIIFKHILPNAFGVLIVNLTINLAGAFVLEAALSFLGFGIKPPKMSLGTLISENQAAFASRPWMFWWPGLFIVAMALSVNLLGDGLRDAFDPRTKRIPSQKAMDRSLQLDAERAVPAVANAGSHS